MDKSQKKLFHFLLLTLILRSTFDIYKFISLLILFSFWVLHWLIYKRSDYLISRGSRGRLEHAKLLVLYNALIVIDFLVSYTFYEKFLMKGERMNEIYVIIGFEVSVSAIFVNCGLTRIICIPIELVKDSQKFRFY